MCKKCRDAIRERAMTHFLNTRELPVDTRAVFEAGVKFGEMQTALFLEKATIDNTKQTEVNPIVGIISQVFGVDPAQVQANLPPHPVDPVDAIANRVMGELTAHFEQEGLALLYGTPTKADMDNYNSLRKVHELPMKTLATAN